MAHLPSVAEELRRLIDAAIAELEREFDEMADAAEAPGAVEVLAESSATDRKRQLRTLALALTLARARM
ncbi:MAG: hypothetical protein GY719_25985 [bacterium]|nr:hypothetical protein [bacterium]